MSGSTNFGPSKTPRGRRQPGVPDWQVRNWGAKVLSAGKATKYRPTWEGRMDPVQQRFDEIEWTYATGDEKALKELEERGQPRLQVFGQRRSRG